MVKVSEIKDRGSLKAWLLDRPEDETKTFAITIAHRAAMRVLPMYWEWVETSDSARERDLTALPILRCNLISGVAREMPTPEIRRAADSAAAGFAFAAAADSAFTAAAAFAAGFAFAAAADSAAAAAADSADSADSAAFAATPVSDSAAAADLWKQIRNDCKALQSGDLLLAAPLWHGDENPFQKEWDVLCQSLPVATPARSEETARGAVPIDWSFWINWYQDALEGREPNWEMLEEIAGIGKDHPITEEDWEKGPARVNFLIGEVERKYAAQLPTGEDFDLNEEDKYQAKPRSTLPARTLKDANDRIRDVVVLINTSQEKSNQYTALIPEGELLDDYLTRYGDNPLRLYEVCSKVVLHIGRHVAEGNLPENDNIVGDVTGDLQNTADDIYNFDAEARAAIQGRARMRYARLDEDQKELGGRFSEAVAQNSEDKTAYEIRDDAEVVQSEDEPTEETTPNRYRLGTRLVRVLVIGGKALRRVLEGLALGGGAGATVVAIWAFVRALLGF